VLEPTFDLESGIADHEGTTRATHALDGFSGRAPHQARLSAAEPVTKNEARENDARSGRQIDRQLLDGLDGALGDDGDTAHGAAGADGAPSHHTEVAYARRCCDWHEAEVSFVFGDLPRHLARGCAVETESGGGGLAVEALVKRASIQIRNCGDT
jgi:hypothetical protein